MQPLSGDQRPDLRPNSSDEHVCCTAPATRNPSLQILFKCPTPAIVFGNARKTLTFCSLLTRCRIPCACHAKRHLNVQKWSVPRSFYTCDLEMCFAPQRRALFRHLNFQKRSEHEAFCTFGFEMCFAPQWVHFFDIATSKSAPNVRCF